MLLLWTCFVTSMNDREDLVFYWFSLFLKLIAKSGI